MKTKYALIGGFLGSSKTTSMIALAQHVARSGSSVGLITNDQSVGLVDTARALGAGFPTQEVTGSCFCCNFDGLIKASRDLSSAGVHPNIIIAEAVGSCTDLRATIANPMTKLHGGSYEMAPLSVFVDPIRFGQRVGLIKGGVLSSKILYIYEKQLEEADAIVISKTDTIGVDLLAQLVRVARLRYPRARVFEVSNVTGKGLSDWFEYVLTGQPVERPSMFVNYNVYAEGEALLGWLNLQQRINPTGLMNGNEFLTDFSGALQKRLAGMSIEIAHLKVSLTNKDGSKLGAVSVTRSDDDPFLTNRVRPFEGEVDLTVNLRAEGDPGILKTVVSNTLETCAIPVPSLIHAFRPGKPNPTHRMASAA